MSIRIVGWILLCGLAVAGAPAQAEDSVAGGGAPWPRRIEKDGNVLLVYHPQMESWKNRLELTGRVAAVVWRKGEAAAAGGSFDFAARTDHDAGAGRVVLTDIRISGAHFPASAEAGAVGRELFPKSGLTLSLDYMLAALALSGEKIPGVAVSDTPPEIFVSEQPSRLVVFEGEPLFAPVEGTGLEYALNTNWPLFRSRGDGYFLLDASGWLTAETLHVDNWGYADGLPPDFDKLPDTAQWKDVRDRIPAAPSGSLPPLEIFVATGPAEMISVVGKIDWKKIDGSIVMYAQNTSSLLFWDRADKDFYYYLVAGRWFRSRSLEGPWKYASRDLPKEFASIPADGPLAAVLASVPGTAEAREAAFRSTIPHVAVVDFEKAKATAVYAGEPSFAPIEGTAMSYAINSSDDVIRAAERYYLCENGVWFTSALPVGPWTVAGSVPAEIYTIPPNSPVYHTTYVRLYESDADSAVYGYTDGYLGSYVGDGVLVWGSGYTYPPYIKAGAKPAFIPRPYTYGCDAFYDPAAGAFRRGGYGYGPRGGVGAAAVFSPDTETYTRGDVAHGSDGAVAYGLAFNPGIGLDGPGGRQTDPYAVWQEAVVPRGARFAPTDVEDDDQPTAVAGGSDVQVYAAPDGTLYRHVGDGWEAYQPVRSDAQGDTAPGSDDEPAAPREAEMVSSAPGGAGGDNSGRREAEVVRSAPIAEFDSAQGDVEADSTAPVDDDDDYDDDSAQGVAAGAYGDRRLYYRDMEGERLARRRAVVNAGRARSFGRGDYRGIGGGRFAGRRGRR